MIRFTLAAAAAVTALLAGDAAEAQVFSQVDRNRDGVISWEEARRAFDHVARPHFNTCDRTNTGTLSSAAEFHCLRSINEVLEVRGRRL